MFCLQFHIFYFTYIFPFTVKVLCLSLHALNFSADDEKKAKREPESSPNTSVEEAKTEVEGGSSGSQGTALKRAYSLSDLNKPNVPRRILPAPPANVSGKKGAGPLMSSTPTRPASSQSSDNERIRQRRKSIDDRSDRGSEYGGSRSEYGGSRKGSSKSPGPVLSRLEQHERMLAERERERRDQQRLVSMGQRSSSRGDLRPKSVTETESDRDLPSYMRSTSASIKKEKLTGGGGGSNPVDRVRRRSSTHHHTQSQGDLRRISGVDQDTSSEEDMSWSKHHRSSSQDRRNGDMRPGPGRAKSERDLSRVARVNLGSGGGSRDNVSTPVQQKQRTKMKTTTIISGDGAVVVNNPDHPQFAVRGTEAVDVTRAPLSRQLAERCGAKMQEAADDLVKLYKRISLDDDLDDTLRGELLSQLSAGASLTAGTLRLVTGDNGETPTRGSKTPAPAGPVTNTQSPVSHQHLSANPYFQHMIQNYSNMMRAGQQQSPVSPQTQSQSSNQDKLESKNWKGPSWC